MARVGYGKIGRSMPLRLENCGTLGGDVEMAAVVKTLAQRRPQDTFVLIGRNDGSTPAEAGLPSNVENPWTEWRAVLREERTRAGLNKSNLTVTDHFAVQKIFDELTLDTITGLDAIILWDGQHGTTNAPLPGVRDPGKLTKPYDWCAWYAAFLLRGVNAWRDVDPWRREEIHLNADPRNYLKLRDLKWPLRHPILAQFNFENNIKHARYGDGSDFEEWSGHDFAGLAQPEDRDRVWLSRVQNIYSRLEVNGLVPGSPFGDLVSFSDEWGGRGHFGLFINEARSAGIAEAKTRLTALREWALPLDPTWIHGTWSRESQAAVGREITSAPWESYYPRLHSVRCTFTTPSSGSGWATTKPWEAFAAGTVCFFHPAYDVQDNILGDAHPALHEWLRVRTPAELASRVAHLSADAGRSDWEWLVAAQREHFDRAIRELNYASMINERLDEGIDR